MKLTRGSMRSPRIGGLQSFEQLREVPPRRLLVTLEELRRAIDPRARQETREDLPPSREIDLPRHPGVLRGDLPVILPELLRRLPQDGQVDVAEESRVSALGLPRVSGRQDQIE